jgi:hypothetical protein
MSDGFVIAEAEGFVGEDEPTWFGGVTKAWKWGEQRGQKIWYDKELPKRPDYAIRAMAQTRAISRACRSAFAHVVVMMNAGLSTTPAEEVPDGGFVDAEFTPVKPASKPDVPEETDADVVDRHTKAILALTTTDACDAYYAQHGQAIKDRLPKELGSPLFAKLKARHDALATQQSSNPFEDAA